MALGAPALIAYEAVGVGRTHTRVAIVYVVAVTSLLTFFASLIFLCAPEEWHVMAVPLVLSAQFALQITLSGHQKGAGKGALASFSESGIYILILAVIVLHTLNVSIDLSIFVLSILSQILLSVLLLKSVDLKAVPRVREWRGFVTEGPKIMASSFIFILMTTAPRLLIENTAGSAALAEFALSYRWLTIAVAAHQFIGTVFFKSIYTDSLPGRGLKLLAPVVAVGFLSTLIVCVLWLLPGFPMIRLPFAIPGVEARTYLMLLAAAMPLWSGCALIEGIFYRERMPLRLILAFLAGLLSTVMVFFVATLSRVSPAEAASLAWLAGLSCASFVQLVMLGRAGMQVRSLGLLFASIIFACLIMQTLFGMHSHVG